jgi:nitronate monooxygenase
MWPRTDLLDLLGITHPIIQAPMSGFSGPALVAAVSNAGALGSLSCVALSAQTARGQIEEIRRASNRPFNLNFFVHPAPSIDAQAVRRVGERLAAYYDEFGLGAVPEPSDPLPRFDEERLQLVLDLKPPVVSFHFGLPPADTMKRIKHTGAVVLSSATTVAEARKLEAEGADAIIAQGLEAGGHRGTFTQGDGAGLIGTMALVPQVADAVGVPVIAAGGNNHAVEAVSERIFVVQPISQLAGRYSILQNVAGRQINDRCTRRGQYVSGPSDFNFA